MPKYPAHEDDADCVRDVLRKHDGLGHLRVRRRADLLTLESGPEDDPVRHARLRRVAVHLWRLEVAHHTAWQSTPVRGPIDKVLDELLSDFGWILESLDFDPQRTSDPSD